MTMKLLIAAAALSAGASHAQESEAPEAIDALRALAAENAYVLNVGEEGLSGPGAGFLMENAQAAQFVAIGEQHATADIADFAQAWFSALDGHGFDYMAMEVGPHSTRRAEELLAGEPGVFETDAAARAGGLAYPFLFFEEETALAREVIVRHDGAGPALWGLDQEFIGSGSILLDILRPLADTSGREAVISEIETALAEQPFLVGEGSQEQWTAWAEAWGEGSGADIFADILHSNRVYAVFTGRGGEVYTANQARENSMKDLFAARFAEAQALNGAQPRVFLKFGANHLTRGRSPIHVATLGNFLAEWGRPRGFSLFNVMADCAGGEVVDVRSGESTPCQSYYAIEPNIFAELADEAPVVVNLAALRAHAAGVDDEIDAALVDLIFAYDAYIAFPDVRPAQLITAD